MSFGFLKSKNFFILTFIIALLAGGFFIWQSQKPTPPEEWDTAEVSKREDYKIIEEDDGLLVKNEKAGLSLEVPEGWEFEENFSTSSGSGGVSFASPDMVTATRTSIVKEGCRLKSAVIKIKTDFDTFEKKFKERAQEQESLNSAINTKSLNSTNIKEYKAIRREFQHDKYNMYFVRIEIPANQNLYEIGLDSANKNKEKCIQEFDKIINTISIK